MTTIVIRQNFGQGLKSENHLKKIITITFKITNIKTIYVKLVMFPDILHIQVISPTETVHFVL